MGGGRLRGGFAFNDLCALLALPPESAGTKGHRTGTRTSARETSQSGANEARRNCFGCHPRGRDGWLGDFSLARDRECIRGTGWPVPPPFFPTFFLCVFFFHHNNGA